MLLKMGVDVSRLKRPIRRALGPIDEVYRSLGVEAVITSTYEGVHRPDSLHYADLAVDVRKAPIAARRILAGLRKALGPDYDVVASEACIHVEYDP